VLGIINQIFKPSLVFRHTRIFNACEINKIWRSGLDLSCVR
jgi:hypothetical protein